MYAIEASIMTLVSFKCSIIEIKSFEKPLKMLCCNYYIITVKVRNIKDC